MVACGFAVFPERVCHDQKEIDTLRCVDRHPRKNAANADGAFLVRTTRPTEKIVRSGIAAAARGIGIVEILGDDEEEVLDNAGS